MASKIKVSIIVPIYNVEEYLERCIESLINQTLKEIEIILVNDGSPDNSQLIIDKYVKKYPGKVVGLIKENGGLSDARNYGIPYAKGEFIGFVDSDDYTDVTMYEKMYNKAIESDSDIVTCGYYGIDESIENYRYFQKGNMIQFGKSIEDNPKLLYTNAPYAWNKIYKRELFEKTGILFPKGMIYEDIATIYPLMMYAKRISKVDEALYYYILKREGAITATFSPKILQMYDALARMNDLYIKAGRFEEFKEVLGFINLKHTILRFRDFTLYNDHKLQRVMVKRGMSQLHNYFPDWRKNKTFFDFYFKNKRLVSFLSKHKITWEFYILIPNPILNFGKKIGKYVKKVKNVITKKSYFNKYYYVTCCRKKPVIKNQVLFESFHGTTLNDSPFAMMRELAKDGNYKMFYTSRKELMPEHQKMLNEYGLNTELVHLGSRKYQKILATSEYLVNNVSFPTYFIRRKDQKYINTWHGTPLKTLGKRMANGIQDMSNMQRNFLESTHLLHPNKFTMDHMMEDYNLNNLYTGKVLLEGYPRNSIFLDRISEAKVRKQYSMDGKEVFAYMPTWRGAMSSGANANSYEEEVLSILKSIDGVLTDQQIFYVNLHPLVKDKIAIDGFKHIEKFPDNINSYDFLNAVDVLITDYSSVFFDYSITKKPVVLFMYDYDTYMSERGMYMDVKDLPFTKIYNLKDFLDYLSSENKTVDYSKKEYKDYSQQFLPFDSKDSIKNINDYFFKDKNNGIQVFDYQKNLEIEHTLFLAPKIKHRNNYHKLEVVDEMVNPVAVFLRREFTSHTIDILSKRYNHYLDYVVVDTQMYLTFWENVRLFFCRELKKYKVNDLYRREIERLLPGIKIKNVVCGEDTFRNLSMKYSIEEEQR